MSEAWPKKATVEFSVQAVNPEVLGILTGGVMGTPPEPTFSVEIQGYHQRKWWQWLLRRPRQKYHYFIPNAKMADRSVD